MDGGVVEFLQRDRAVVSDPHFADHVETGKDAGDDRVGAHVSVIIVVPAEPLTHVGDEQGLPFEVLLDASSAKRGRLVQQR